MPIFELGRGCLDKSRVKIWFRLVEAFKSYHPEKPNDTRTRTKIFKVRSRSSPIGELKKRLQFKKKKKKKKKKSGFQLIGKKKKILMHQCI